MFTRFLLDLKAAEVPVSLREYLTLLEAMKADLADMKVEHFYYLSRSALVKDERHIDRFDRVFAEVFKGIESLAEGVVGETELPEDWLRAMTQKYLSEEEKAEIEKLGGWDELMKTLEERLKEQKERHQGGSKWIGTGGTSPFGNSGYHPEGVRIGGQSRNKRAVKVWEKREFRNLSDDVALGTRNIKLALRKLRRFAREGAPDEFDLDGTIKGTARSGYLDVKMRPERRNTIKVLLFFDIGGSMDPYIRLCEELFSAARAEFKHLEFFYFHNFLYDYVWKDNARRWNDRTQTWDVLHTYGSDYVVIFVGDASMSPYEITMPGGSVEYLNEEPGALWMQRLTDIYARTIWLNPIPKDRWSYTPSIQMTRELIDDRMFPLTLEGLDDAMAVLRR
ncbi:vWA domain-containing protein [Parvularcula oceani]|uniref:vWA domain-containing protein n=1 Tax=Parvularcula oceani TaxID=1247963 RepID=UPI0004E22B6E|nr:VWA domain-containing protein [Parvularcula oceani]